MKLRLSSAAVSSVEIRVTSFTDALRSITRALPSGILVFSPDPSIATVGGSDGFFIGGATEIWVGTIAALAAGDRTDILTETGAIAASSGIAFDTISKVGSRWSAESAQITPTSLAAVLSADTTRTTLSGLAEILGYLLVSAGQTELSLPSLVVVDQTTQQMGFVNDAGNLTVGTSAITYKSAIKEISTDTQDFMETF